MRYHKPEYQFRTKFIYNNYMYTLGGVVAEVLERESWEELTRTRLLEPLGMTSSGFLSDVRMTDKIARSYTLVDGKYVEVSRNLTQ